MDNSQDLFGESQKSTQGGGDVEEKEKRVCFDIFFPYFNTFTDINRPPWNGYPYQWNINCTKIICK